MIDTPLSVGALFSRSFARVRGQPAFCAPALLASFAPAFIGFAFDNHELRCSCRDLNGGHKNARLLCSCSAGTNFTPTINAEAQFRRPKGRGVLSHWFH